MLLLKKRRIPFGQMFAKLSNDLTKLYSFSNFDSVSGVHIIQLIYDMCTARPQPYIQQLFHALARYLEEHTSHLLLQIIHSDNPLQAYATHWEQYSLASIYIDSLCIYLNKRLQKLASETGPTQNYATRLTAHPSDILSLSRRIWRYRVLNAIRDQYDNLLVNQAFGIIASGRQGVHNAATTIVTSAASATHPSLVRRFVDSVCVIDPTPSSHLSWYFIEFKSPYISRLRHYCQKRARDLFDSLDIVSFMEQISALLVTETANGERYCHPSSLQEVVTCCERALISPYVTRLQTELDMAIFTGNLYSCALAYSLLARIADGIQPALETYEQFVVEGGRQIKRAVASTEFKDLREVVEKLMHFHTKQLQACQDVFRNDPAFTAALDKAFRTVVNEQRTKALYAPELFAKYCDLVLLRRPTRASLSETDREGRLHQMLHLFKYIDDKDVFQKFYTRALARRLMFNQCASPDTEATIVAQLQSVCGVEYTNKLNQMFNDVAMSETLSQEFARSGPGAPVTRMKSMVLTARQLSSTAAAGRDFKFPGELLDSFNRFVEFYHSKHSGRKLTWLWQFAKADVKLNYLDKKYEVHMTLHQLALLLQFERIDRLSIPELAALTELSPLETLYHTQPLVDMGLLTVDASSSSTPSVSAVSDDTTVPPTNERSALTKGRGDSLESSEATRRVVEEDRRLYLQALIVRIMKTRRQLSHNQLVAEVIQMGQQRFRPDVPLVKKCVEQLINKEYIERDENNRDMYVYVT
ncbi:Cullin family-domain-containing protein [Dimargaris cristalligena]|uniref:Cullin family-domain-containing protein n=1 Tax=Dimargaris cristalligena TaxID=215637 RepID=A0A4P9ZXF7_9FUNG|nr:Cullin family-domain-containing protein [Dimargaris cristalligena]|eukprot:RKP38385.1 Cullin family-domain-containing protein [Dimargaris cristalligena]